MPTLVRETDVKERQLIDQQISAADYKALVRRLKRFEGRLRFQECVRNLPYAFIGGGVVGLLVALYSRFTPSLTVDQVLIIAGATLLIAIAGTLGYSLFRPRKLIDTARQVDLRLKLKERLTTAIEGYNRPQKLGYVNLGPRQFADAKETIDKTPTRKSFPLRMNLRAVLVALIMVPLLAIALFATNDNAAIAKDNEVIAQQVDKEVKAIEDVKSKIKDEAQKYKLPENDPKLQELLKQLDEAKKDLQDNKYNKDQALASLEKAQQELSKLSDQNLNAEKAAFESLARDLRNTDTTKPAGDALNKSNDPDRFNNAAAELDKAANNLDNLKNNPDQAQQLSDALAKDAKLFQNSNPELANKLNNAAQSLQPDNLKQNPGQAQQALKDLSKQIGQAGKDQQFQEQLQQAQSQLQKSEQSVGQAGQRSQNNSSSKPGQAGKDFGNSSSDSLGQAGDPSNENNIETIDPNSGDQAGNQDAAAGSQNQVGQSQQQGQNGQQGNGQGQGQGQNGTQSLNGQGQQGQGDGQGQQGQGDGQGQGQGNGQGQGQSQGNGQGQSGQGRGAGKGSVDNVYQDPTKRNEKGTRTNLKGKDGEGPNSTQNTNQGDATGSTNVPYNQVLQEYSQEASEALDKNYVPLTLKDIIKQYFDDLEKRS